MGNFIELKAADGTAFAAYVAQPAGQPRGGVVVVQEIFGVNAHIRAVADGYAADGYLAVAPATFDRVKRNVDLGYTPEDIQAGAALKAAVEALPAPGVLQDIQAAIDHAAQAGKVGIVGYCYGGLHHVVNGVVAKPVVVVGPVAVQADERHHRDAGRARLR